MYKLSSQASNAYFCWGLTTGIIESTYLSSAESFMTFEFKKILGFFISLTSPIFYSDYGGQNRPSVVIEI